MRALGARTPKIDPIAPGSVLGCTTVPGAPSHRLQGRGDKHQGPLREGAAGAPAGWDARGGQRTVCTGRRVSCCHKALLLHFGIKMYVCVCVDVSVVYVRVSVYHRVSTPMCICVHACVCDGNADPNPKGGLPWEPAFGYR